MNNIIKHSNATQVQITVREHPSFYQLLITDNGSVKAPEDMTEVTTGGMGLQNMRTAWKLFTAFCISVINRDTAYLYRSRNRNRKD